MSGFSVVGPPADAVRAALIAHVPHASVVIPAAVREELLLTDSELRSELQRLTDWYTDDLFAGITGLGATTFVNELSRLVFDPERILDDAAEPAAGFGQGVVYWRGTQGQALRAEDPGLRVRRIEELYRPYHAALDRLVGETLAEYGSCTLVDCHSFPTQPLPTERPSGAMRRPDVCIGTDPLHTPATLADGLVAAFTAAGLSVARNVPYAGTFVPGGYFGREPRVHSVMIEVRRGLYMDERSTERLPTFGSVAAAIVGAVLEALALA